MEAIINAYKCWSEGLKERDHLEDLGIDGRTILKWIENYDGTVWTTFIWHRKGTSGGLL
jgi:uncharacterized protein YjcR